MRVDRLFLRDYRNIREQSLDFSPEVNIILGENAQGKTNILEAIYCLTGSRSFRARADTELINFDRDSSDVFATVFSQGREQELQLRLKRGLRRSVTINGVKQKSGAALSEKLNCVIFAPEHLELVRGAGGMRRRFLDAAISQLRPRYAQAVLEYNRLHEHKTRILRDCAQKPSLLEALDDFSLRMCQAGAVIMHYRAHYIKKLRSFAPPLHSEISGGREELEIKYSTVSAVPDPELAPKELAPLLYARACELKNAEIDARGCLTGVHRDELELTINGVSARAYGSQGQTRTAALSLKLAERDLNADDTGERPVLLLDDVLSELDHRRRDYVINRIAGGQVFITCCEEPGSLGGRVFRVAGGAVEKIENGNGD